MNPTRFDHPHLPYPPGMQTTRIINPFRRATGGGGGASTLLDGLLHWWDLNEASGNAIDATGNQDLTDNNTVGAGSGTAPDGGNTRVFAKANSEYFSTSAGNIWNTGSAVTFAGWFLLNSVSDTTNRAIFGHNAPNGYTKASVITSGRVYDYTDGSFGGVNDILGSVGWHCYVYTSTGPGGSEEVFLNNASYNTSSLGWEPGSAVFYLGAGQTGTEYFDGEMCSVALANRVWTSDEITEFYNSGTNLRSADVGL